jgi:selenocysteine-specific elongation factor
MIAIAEEQGRLVTVATDMTFHQDAIARAQKLIADCVRSEGPMEPSCFRDLIGSSRKFAIPLLEHLDRIGFTRRVGNHRVLSEAQDDAGAAGPRSDP